MEGAKGKPQTEMNRRVNVEDTMPVRHVFIIGAKNCGLYGGFETFLDKLTEYHQNNKRIKYHIAWKGREAKEFEYHNAHCFQIKVPDFGTAQAIYYDVAALNYCVRYIKTHKIEKPIVYILACRIGPFVAYFQKGVHKLGGRLYNNCDGRENKRRKYAWIVRAYWKLSEKLTIKHSDLIVCDSKNIEIYIRDEYKKYSPKTIYIAYGSELHPCVEEKNDFKLSQWYKEKGLQEKEYFLAVGRFVPENNYEVMLKEFMASKTEKNFAIITTENKKFVAELEAKLHFSEDKRIKFVGTVYDQELLQKIRENAFAYLHGHEVGGTNPSLLEALGSTELNLLLDVGFNREVAESSALYWTKKVGSLAELIDKADKLNSDEIAQFGCLAKNRIREDYTWDKICGKYEKLFLDEMK